MVIRPRTSKASNGLTALNPGVEGLMSNKESAISMNYSVANRLNEVAQILEEQGANVFRIGAYRRAAAMLRGLKEPIDQIVKTEGLEGLQQLPGIGETLARFIHQLVVTGRLPMLDRLRGESDPIALLRTVPGIGKATAERLHDQLGIETLEELEIAAHDGRLAKIAHLGGKRIAGIRDSLATRLGRLRIQGTFWPPSEPTVSEILDVDTEYRKLAAVGKLPKIAPRRFNPEHKRWLPILHTVRGKRHYTALFSNTPRARQLHKTSDWVVIYYDGRGGERQCTVITSAFGPLAGRRIIRGREPECVTHYLHPIVANVPSGKVMNGFDF
jgi:DNA polymerase (family X)